MGQNVWLQGGGCCTQSLVGRSSTATLSWVKLAGNIILVS